MTPLTILPVIAAAFAAAFVLTAGARRYALRTNMIDAPGPRSSHAVPTPRGGGISIVVCVLAGTLVLSASGVVPPVIAWALLGGGSVVGFTGWLDDRRGLPQWLRAAAYLLAAAIATAVLGAPAGFAAGAAIVLGLAWLTNLYNFMDGTDGLAAVECVSVAAWAAILLHDAGAAGPASLCALLAAAAAGFLCWNWPPAKIFMGDSGSCFIGCVFGVLAVATRDQVTIHAWFILLSVFVCDATFTLLRRALAGEKWYRAHRSHAYQLLARSTLTHGRLALWVLAVNCLVLGPLAMWASREPESAFLIASATGGALFLAWAAVQFRLLRRESPGSSG